MGKLKEILESHPVMVLLAFGFSMIGLGWAGSENIRVNPIQDDLEKTTEKVVEYKSQIKEYESKMELNNLVVYDENISYKEGERFAVLGGQVSIYIEEAESLEDVSFVIDAVGEKELQKIQSESDKRAIFNYNGKKYLINIKDFFDSSWEDSVTISISEVGNNFVEKPEK